MAESATIRPYEPADRDAFLSLYETVFGHSEADEWFAWKYERNPSAEDVPIVVAQQDGQLVGAMPFLVMRMRAGEEALTGRIPGDLMVHPEYRRQGVFSRLSETVNQRLHGDDRTVLFGYPNDAALPGWLGTGYELVGTDPARYRLQDPGSFVDSRTDLPGSEEVGRAATALARGTLALLGRRRTPPDGYSITRFETVPADEFAALYREHAPDEIHTIRDETFYDWRFGNPRWDYTAYVAAADGTPVAGTVVGTQDRDGGRAARLTDVVPLADGPADAWRALLGAVCTDHDDARLVTAPADPLPGSVLSSFGFLPRRLLGPLVSERPRIVRTPDGTDWSVAGLDVRVPGNWRLSFSDRDTA